VTKYQREFHRDNLPTCQIFDKPAIRVINQVEGKCDRPQDKVPCGALSTGSGVYIVADDKFCLNNVPNPTVNATLQEKEVTMAHITFKIKKNGINVIKEYTINKLIAHESKTITFIKDQQKKFLQDIEIAPNVTKKC